MKKFLVIVATVVAATIVFVAPTFAGNYPGARPCNYDAFAEPYSGYDKAWPAVRGLRQISRVCPGQTVHMDNYAVPIVWVDNHGHKYSICKHVNNRYRCWLVGYRDVDVDDTDADNNSNGGTCLKSPIHTKANECHRGNGWHSHGGNKHRHD